MGKTYEALMRAEKENRQKSIEFPLKTSTNLPQVIPQAVPIPRTLERYDELKMNLLIRKVDSSLKTILFTGTHVGSGCSTTAANFAYALAKDQNVRVLLVDTNLRNPALHHMFQFDRSKGVSELLSGDLEISSKIRKVGKGNLSVIPSGANYSEPVYLFESNRFDRMLERINGNFHYVILDSPPITAFSESKALCSKVDGVVLVVESGKTRRQVARKAKNRIEEAGGDILGVVLNKRKHYIPDWLYRRL